MWCKQILVDRIARMNSKKFFCIPVFANLEHQALDMYLPKKERVN